MKIFIEPGKCRHPENCMNCVLVCPAKVFMLKPKRTNQSKKGYDIAAVFRDMCDGCRECEKICPEKCIHIEY
jgi:NAD-dependent dihydropyrimidine dehydrogenase PreA subunit